MKSQYIVLIVSNIRLIDAKVITISRHPMGLTGKAPPPGKAGNMPEIVIKSHCTHILSPIHTKFGKSVGLSKTTNFHIHIALVMPDRKSDKWDYMHSS